MRDRDQDSRAKARAVTWVFIPLGHFGTVKLTALCSKLFVRTLTSYVYGNTYNQTHTRSQSVCILIPYSFRFVYPQQHNNPLRLLRAAAALYGLNKLRVHTRVSIQQAPSPTQRYSRSHPALDPILDALPLGGSPPYTPHVSPHPADRMLAARLGKWFPDRPQVPFRSDASWRSPIVLALCSQ